MCPSWCHDRRVHPGVSGFPERHKATSTDGGEESAGHSANNPLHSEYLGRNNNRARVLTLDSLSQGHVTVSAYRIWVRQSPRNEASAVVFVEVKRKMLEDRFQPVRKVVRFCFFRRMLSYPPLTMTESICFRFWSTVEESNLSKCFIMVSVLPESRSRWGC